MTLNQLTHSTGIEWDFGLARMLARGIGWVGALRAARRLERELAMLDHRERADLAWRR
jgi:hypothetical protein